VILHWEGAGDAVLEPAHAVIEGHDLFEDGKPRREGERADVAFDGDRGDSGEPVDDPGRISDDLPNIVSASVDSSM